MWEVMNKRYELRVKEECVDVGQFIVHKIRAKIILANLRARRSRYYILHVSVMEQEFRGREKRCSLLRAKMFKSCLR